jgi:hypothetical protein
LLGGEIAFARLLAERLQEDRFQVGVEPIVGASVEIPRRLRAASPP